MSKHIEAGNYVEGSGFRGVRVVITGMGAVTPLGLNTDETWINLLRGTSGVELLDPSFNDRVKIGAQVKNFVTPDIFSFSDLKGVHTSALFSTTALLEARMSAKLPLDTEELEEIIGIRIGSGVGGSSFIAEIQEAFSKGRDRSVHTKSILQILLERVATVPGIKSKTKGPTASSVAACATGNQNIIDAVRIITAGDADIMYAGATEGPIEKIGMASFSQARALSTRNNDPKAASRPFDKDRDGFVMGAGSVVLVLEELNHALERGTYIYGEIKGYGEKADAFDDVFPDGIGSEKAMRRALDKASLLPQEIGYINVHGTGTKADELERNAMLRIFKDCNPRPLVSCTKAMTAHLLGASGALESMICLKVIETGMIPPTINLDNPIDTDFDYVPYIPGKVRQAAVSNALNNNFGFGGLDVVTLFSKYIP